MVTLHLNPCMLMPGGSSRGVRAVVHTLRVCEQPHRGRSRRVHICSKIHTPAVVHTLLLCEQPHRGRNRRVHICSEKPTPCLHATSVWWLKSAGFFYWAPPDTKTPTVVMLKDLPWWRFDRQRCMRCWTILPCSLTSAHWLINAQLGCSLTQPQSPISLTQTRWGCLSQPSSTRKLHKEQLVSQVRPQVKDFHLDVSNQHSVDGPQ